MLEDVWGRQDGTSLVWQMSGDRADFFAKAGMPFAQPVYPAQATPAPVRAASNPASASGGHETGNIPVPARIELAPQTWQGANPFASFSWQMSGDRADFFAQAGMPFAQTAYPAQATPVPVPAASNPAPASGGHDTGSNPVPAPIDPPTADAPDAVDDSFTVSEDGLVTALDLLTNDSGAETGDVLMILSLDTSGTLGLVSLNADGDSVTYDPDGAFAHLATGDTATDTFIYTVSDGKGGADTASVTVTVTGADSGMDDDTVTIAPSPTSGGGPVSGGDSGGLGDFEARVLHLVNDIRARNGLDSLENDAMLNDAAEDWSMTMATQDFFAHSSPAQAEEYGYDWAAWGENIAAGQDTPESVVQAWIDSPEHRANMLSEDFRDIGIGYYQLADDTGTVNYGHYWTQVFGTEGDSLLG